MPRVNIFKNTPLMREIPKIFAPLYINTDILKSTKILALNQFVEVFFPHLASNILTLLLDMEQHSHKLVAAIPPEKRASLIEKLKGITVEIRYMLKDRGKEMIALPISITPSDVLENAALGRPLLRNNHEMQKELTNIIITVIKNEIHNKIKTIIEGILKTLLTKPRMPVLLKELLQKGYINREGRLTEGATIENFISGKYARLFKRISPEELLNEGLLIRETLMTCCQAADEDPQARINEALREKELLDITLKEMAKPQKET